VRRRFEGRFTARRMARDYLGLYGRLVGVAWSPSGPRLTLTRQARASGNGAGLTS
jgi:hypothetical protein